MTAPTDYIDSDKINNWVIDRKGRTIELPWRCWQPIDDLNTREKSFATKEEAIDYAKDHN